MKAILKSLSIMLLVAGTLLPVAAPVRAGDAQPSGQDTASPALDALPPADALGWLEGLPVFHAQDRLRDEVKRAFNGRMAEGVRQAIATLHLPERDARGRRIDGRDRAYFVARVILQSFPETAAGLIAAAYASADTATRANLINVSGTIAGAGITDLLRRALDDTTVAEDLDSEIAGTALRLCDLAYNQLVLRFRVRSVLRTIGPDFRMADRDYHIAVLKTKI